jgi:hypothetical protein
MYKSVKYLNTKHGRGVANIQKGPVNKEMTHYAILYVGVVSQLPSHFKLYLILLKLDEQ